MGSPRPDSAACAGGLSNDTSRDERYTPAVSPATKVSARRAFSLRRFIFEISRIQVVELSRFRGSSTRRRYRTVEVLDPRHATTTPPDATTIRNPPNLKERQGVVSDVPDWWLKYRSRLTRSGSHRSSLSSNRRAPLKAASLPVHNARGPLTSRSRAWRVIRSPFRTRDLRPAPSAPRGSLSGFTPGSGRWDKRAPRVLCASGRGWQGYR